MYFIPHLSSEIINLLYLLCHVEYLITGLLTFLFFLWAFFHLMSHLTTCITDSFLSLGFCTSRRNMSYVCIVIVTCYTFLFHRFLFVCSLMRCTFTFCICIMWSFVLLYFWFESRWQWSSIASNISTSANLCRRTWFYRFSFGIPRIYLYSIWDNSLSHLH